mmetsp:Transcript_148441/g.377539  ORF Transcript_148441/g.377539 Transcript_148441/m.377539 type:complete len:146 (-) Transcript_148441:2-439(-)
MWLRHCSPAFMKHVFPKFLRPMRPALGGKRRSPQPASSGPSLAASAVPWSPLEAVDLPPKVGMPARKTNHRGRGAWLCHPSRPHGAQWFQRRHATLCVATRLCKAVNGSKVPGQIGGRLVRQGTLLQGERSPHYVQGDFGCTLST